MIESVVMIKTSPNSDDAQQHQEDEISLLDIVLFLKRTWKLIAVAGLLGVACSMIYLAITPSQYQASAQIQMAQIGASSNKNNLNPSGVNVEEPGLLIARLSTPTSFTPEAITACGLEGVKDANSVLAKSIKLSLPKGVANVVDLKTTGQTPQGAAQCATAIFDLIKNTQAQIVKPYSEEASVKLADSEERLARAKDLVLRADKSGSGMGAAYLSTRDEISYLLDEIAALKNMLVNNQNRITRLVAPIYASDNPVAPKKPIVLLGGLFGGIFVGLLIAIGRQVAPKLKEQLSRTEVSQ